MPTNTFTWSNFDQTSPKHQALHGFLVLDVQYSSKHANEIRAGIKAYRSKQRNAFEGSGNGYEFECQPQGFYLNGLYEGDPLTPVTIDYPTTEQALSEWADYCQKLETTQIK